MEIGTAIKLLNMYLELNPYRHDMGTAVKTVLAELDKQKQEKKQKYVKLYTKKVLKEVK